MLGTMEKRRLELSRFLSRAARALVGVGACVLLASPALAQGTREYQLRWRVSPEPDVASYRVFLGNASRTYGAPVNVGEPAPDASGVASTLLTGLDASADYYVAMTAVDSAGNESALSNEIVVAAAACTVAQCNDANSCTVDSCGATGCIHSNVADGTGCSDGNASTFLDVCRAGVCVGQTPQCTSNSQCPDLDSNVCTGGRVCTDYACVATPALSCPAPSNPCQAAACNALTGCTSANVPNGTACNDGNASTMNDVCTSGTCAGTVAACTSDAQCPDLDANVCNGGRVCSGVACVAGPLAPDGMSCDDGDPLTQGDVCQAGTCRGRHECESDADCPDADANVCTGRPTCSNFRCVAGAPLSCTAAHVCADPVCDPRQGCVFDWHEPGTSCDDGDAETANDVCVADGVCAGELPPPPTPAGCEDAFGAPTAWRLALTDRPESTATVVWDAPRNPSGAEVRYHRAGSAEWYSLRGEIRREDGCEATFAAALTGLAPNAAYEYAVSGAGASGPLWTKPATFTTAPAAGTDGVLRVLFVAGVGSAGAPGAAAAAAVRNGMARYRPNFVLGGGGYAHAGDAVGAGLAADADGAVGRWFEQMTPVFARAAFVPAYGDGETEAYWHDETREMYASRQPTFAPGGPRASYSFDASGSHFVVIDAPTAAALLPTTSEGAAHLSWLANDLAAARVRGVRYIVVAEHLDLWSSELGAPAVASVRGALAAIFERHRVNLVLSGDGTSTERSWPIAGGLPVQTRGTYYSRGVAYLRAGAGGRSTFGAWAQPTKPAWSAVRDNQKPQFVLIKVRAGRAMRVNSIAVDPATGLSEVVDSFYIR